jgi:hypothetical protein
LNSRQWDFPASKGIDVPAELGLLPAHRGRLVMQARKRLGKASFLRNL